MNGEEGLVVASVEAPSHVEKILVGLWQQREELGLVADELLDLFRVYGMSPPPEEEQGHN